MDNISNTRYYNVDDANTAGVNFVVVVPSFTSKWKWVPKPVVTGFIKKGPNGSATLYITEIGGADV